LSDFQAGQSIIIREAQDDNPHRLRRWSELGLIPGTIVHIVTFEKLDDVFELQLSDRTIRLGSEGLHGLLGEAIEK
jgi:DtxR family transcriptional regulator, Mn-dependent transcriptional regulator